MNLLFQIKVTKFITHYFFNMKRISAFLLFFIISITGVFALVVPEPPSVQGYVVEKSTGNPLEFVSINIKNKKDSIVANTVTDKNGLFVLKNFPEGEYKLNYSFIGYDKSDSIRFIISPKQKKIDFGRLYITEMNKTLGQVEVVGQRSTFVNSIDRKTFNVGQDLMSKSGSVSDLMKNIPSVQVDMDGVVSLRGSENVTILIDGKTSAMMKINRAAVLQQLSANNVEKIEIITNPSAKYKPDGTSGIINIVMKKDKSLGLNGNVTANVGNQQRGNFNGMINYNPGKLNLFASFGVRQDSRIRINDLKSTTFENNIPSYISTYSLGNSRPISYIGSTGFDYKLNDKNKFGASVSYNYRYQEQHDSTNYILQDNTHTTTLNYDRKRFLPESESDLEYTANYLHRFNNNGHELNVNLVTSTTHETEDNRYNNYYRVPSVWNSKDNMMYKHLSYDTEFSAEYTLPINEKSKFEAGYIYQNVQNNLDLKRDSLLTGTNTMVNDLGRSNIFNRSENTHVLYATYEQEIGKFGFLAGVRAEQTFTNAHLVTQDSTILSQYTRFYPTLHASYQLSDVHELQLNYSHRIRRPEDEELNPFPEYQDLRNIRAGNPNLKPEDIHSVELGYQMKKDATTFLSTLYYRNSYNLITNVIEDLGNSIFKTTLQNLSRNQSAGLELILSSSIGKSINFNLATNTFYNTIDASALGFSANKSNFAWSANGNVSVNLTKSTIWQITSNYTAETLTPQGHRLPSFVMNSGLKQELFKKKAAIILTVSDIFNSMRNQMEIDMPDFKRTEIRRRSSQTIYLGFTYSFGSTPKKAKEGSIKYDNSL